jgi:hypothetical protein
MVEAGGNPVHAPARCTYEKLGFGLLPKSFARFFGSKQKKKKIALKI